MSSTDGIADGLIEAYAKSYEELTEKPLATSTPMPPDLQHAHTGKQGWWYVGSSGKASHYHLYRCQGSEAGCTVTMIRPCAEWLGDYAECLVCKVEKHPARHEHR